MRSTIHSIGYSVEQIYARFNINEDDDLDLLEPTNEELDSIEKNKKYIIRNHVESIQQDDLHKRIVGYMSAYFEKQSMFYGGPIRMNNVLTPDNIDMVTRLDLPGAIAVAYAALGDDNEIDNQVTELESIDDLMLDQEIDQEIDEESNFVEEGENKNQKIVITTLDKIHKYGIPKTHAGGILLLHLELCMGYPIP